ncbi:MAG: hypothetical protein GF418_09000 [Chitinivibrionales bacterium]|nr:hypothetical protein [Chitinivibrionales bacterium]MBD3395751.1 hypothetical protein [Chitinivibrionales bacterium]
MIQRTALQIALLAAIALAGPPAVQKPTLAVLNLKNGNDVSEGESQIISDRLRVELFRTGNVEVMEREQMDVILKEQGFQASGACSDEGCMVEMGQLLGVKNMIAGSIGRLGSMYLINCRSVSVATGKIVKVVSVDIKGEIEDVVEELAPIAWKLTSEDTPPSAKARPSAAGSSSGTFKEDDDGDDEKESDILSRTSGPLKCDNRPLLQVPIYEHALPFKIGRSTFVDVCAELIESLQDGFRQNVRLASAEQIQSLPPTCTSPVVRIKLVEYTTEPSSMGQFVGTATVAIAVYDSPQSEKPGYVVKIKESGDRHWGEDVPFENAFEEIASTLEKEFGRSDWAKKYRRKR